MHFLWDAWYCLDLSQAHNSRLKKYLDRLVAKDYGQQYAPVHVIVQHSNDA